MLENIFSDTNILSYANTCLDLAIDIPESRISKGSNKFDTIVIPSRGAVPFFLGITYSLDKLSKSFDGDHENFYKSLGLQKMVSSLLPGNIKIGEVKDKPIKVLLIPFTADLNIPRFDSRLDNDEFTLKTRRYWANVTKSFFESPQERRKNPYFVSFTDLILRDIEGRGELAEIYESFPKVESFSLIDTVISGRAATQILGSFEGMAAKYGNPLLNPSAFLIVDENGEKLKPEYSRYLTRKRLEGTLTMYKTPRIVSEDGGVSLLGVGAAIYPSVMSVSREFQVNGEEFFIGAGAWYNSSNINKTYFYNFTSFMNMMYRAIDLEYSRKYLGQTGETHRESFEEAKESFLDRAKKYKILDKTSDDIRILHPTGNYAYDTCYETHSHVLHAPFKRKSEERLRSKISSIPGVKVIGK